jgi:methylated-DNA-protein-cysteine methyltransferase-like protein
VSDKPFDRVFDIVERIPPGRVATYGQISRMLDGRYSPVFVGWALHAIPESRRGLPWHRVINSKGGISTRQVLGYAPDLQKHLLAEEGIEFDEHDRCDLDRFQWDGR